MFKKKILTIIMVISLLGVCLVACGSEQNKNDNVVQQDETTNKNESENETQNGGKTTKTNVTEEVDEGIIRFRGIRWYSTKKDVENFLFENGAENGGWMSSDNEIYRMSGIDYTSVTTGEDRVDGGGYQGWYSGISVAGYEATDTYACYIYPINADGSIEMSDEEAQFYFGWYTFTQEDYSDINSMYEDLKTKLSSLYGDGQGNKTDFHTTTTWKDIENNQVRLLINNDSTYITLGYMANGAEERLDEMQSALDKIKSQNEAENREENKDNTSGL